MKRILILGGGGFIGLHLARALLAQGFIVDLLDNFQRGVQDLDLESLALDPNVSILVLDACDKGAIKNLRRDYSYIFCLAAVVGVSNVGADPFKTITTNITIIENTLELCKSQKGLRRLFFASTSEVYAGTLENFDISIPTPEATPLTITDLRRSRTSYMLSKIVGEYLCHFSDIPYTIFRPHNVYGPRMGMSHVIPEQLRKAYYSSPGEEIYVESIDQTRTFCYVEDGIRQLMLMMEADVTVGETINLGVEAPEISIGNLVEICHRVVGKQLKIIGAAVTEGSPSRRAPDMSKSTTLIGHSVVTRLEYGIRETFEWYKRNIFSKFDSSLSLDK